MKNLTNLKLISPEALSVAPQQALWRGFWSPGGLELTHSKAKQIGLGLETVPGDLLTLPFANGTFDGVFSQGTFEMFGDRRSEAVREWARVLRPGGIIGVSEATLTHLGVSMHTSTLITLV